MINGSLMKVKSIAECPIIGLQSIFGLFESSRFTHVYIGWDIGFLLHLLSVSHDFFFLFHQSVLIVTVVVRVFILVIRVENRVAPYLMASSAFSKKCKSGISRTMVNIFFNTYARCT